MTAQDIAKALEIWTLQNLLDLSIIMGVLALGLAVIRRYLEALERHLTLRVSLEVWRVLTVLVVDLLLILVALVGLMILNPDILADIKVALPLIPIAVILFTIALVLRLFHGGHDPADRNHGRALWLMFTANVINIIGFTVVMEAPSGAYLARNPSAFWTFVKTGLRSNANLELTQLTFWICFPILMLVYLWAFRSALRQLKPGRPG